MEGQAGILQQRIEAVALDRRPGESRVNGFEANSRKA